MLIINFLVLRAYTIEKEDWKHLIIDANCRMPLSNPIIEMSETQ